MPYAPLFVSCTTLAGKAIAAQKLAGVVDGVFFAPLDLRMAVRGVLRTIRPQLVIVMETEIWPNLYREVKKSGTGLVIVNGRISDKAFPKYCKWRWFFGHVLCWPDKILVQTRRDLERYTRLGAPPEKVLASGNLKYDLSLDLPEPPQAVADLIRDIGANPVWIAASTSAPTTAEDVDEELAVLNAFSELAPAFPRMLLLLVPRKPDRFDHVASKLDESGIPFQRRSRLPGSLVLPGVLLVDSLGELSSLFPLADAVFMGGTLADRGGHNILEPAAACRAVVAGPHMENFAEIAEEFTSNGALLRISAKEELAAAIGKLFSDETLRVDVGQRARGQMDGRRGATAIALRTCAEVYACAVPRLPPNGSTRPLLWYLSELWKFGARWRIRRYLAGSRPLSTPVISVGGIVMGGSGKTPFVLWLTSWLREKGRRPAILTRGYKRRSPDKTVIIDPGAQAPIALTGDEAQLFVRAGVAAVGISANRYHAGKELEKRTNPGIFVLDDGFQHAKLARQLDLVMIDTLDPFGGEDLFPAGRLREPLEALGRADGFVLTRTQPGRRYDGIESRLKRYNPDAPRFRSRVVPKRWVDAVSGEEYGPEQLPVSRVAAFCGLANPASFWLSLESVGLQPVYRWSFGDHHEYKPGEIHTLVAQARTNRAEALLTTEKDLMNLSGEAIRLIAPLRLIWLGIGIEFENEREMLEWIDKRLPPVAAVSPS
jgi:tetraacyldisaccharide 4'-kinase